MPRLGWGTCQTTLASHRWESHDACGVKRQRAGKCCPRGSYPHPVLHGLRRSRTCHAVSTWMRQPRAAFDTARGCKCVDLPQGREIMCEYSSAAACGVGSLLGDSMSQKRWISVIRAPIMIVQLTQDPTAASRDLCAWCDQPCICAHRSTHQ